MTDKGCPFCSIDNVLFENELAFAIPDKFPVRPGHTLVIPRRHVASFFELTDEELVASYELIKKTKDMVDGEYSPDGYKVGINIGRSSGQTVMHVHMHVVPMGGEQIGGRSEVFVRKDFKKEDQ
jgi:diadenosine tetraphosphate (Ap4A) HIT family hydrolase